MKKMAIFVSALLVLIFSSFSFAEVKIGILDVNRVLANLQQIKDMQANLKKQFDGRGQEIVGLQKTFRDDIEKYRKNNATTQGKNLVKEQQDLVNENKKLQEAQLGFQRDLIAAQNKALHPVLEQLGKVVNKIARDQNLDLVVTRVSTAYNDPRLEITDQVIAEMEKPNSDIGFFSRLKKLLK